MKGPFPSPKDEGTAFFITMLRDKLKKFRIQSFCKKHGIQRGISLLEALIALALLAFVLLTSVIVRMTLAKEDSVRTDELSAAALLREKCMDFQSGLITNNISETNTNDIVETGERYYLEGTLQTNDWLAFHRINLTLSIGDRQRGEKVSSYRSRIQLLPVTRPIPGEPLGMDASPSMISLHVFVTNTGGDIKIGGTTTTNTTNNVIYGSTHTLEASSHSGYIFRGWKVDGIGPAGATPTNMYMDEDREVEAVFTSP